MLIIKNLTIKDLKNHSFIENLNYSLGNEDKVGIIGEEGNGKSTFLKALYNPEWIKDYMVMSGEIIMDYKHIGYLEQKLPLVWEDVSVSDYLLKQTPQAEIAYEKYNDLKQYEKLCQQLHLPLSLLQKEQSMATLSGGEKVKLQMLKLMEQPCDLLLLDEPTNDLDIHTLEWMEEFIIECTLPIMFISHDSKLLQNSANVLLHFEQLNHKSKSHISVFKGNYQEYMNQRNNAYEKAIQIAKKEKQDYMKKKIRLNNQRNAVHDALNDTVRNPGQGAQLKRKMSNIKAQEKRFEKERFTKIDSNEDAIQLHFDMIEANAHKKILDIALKQIMIGECILMKDVELHVKGKDKIIFIGDNGCGKSVLIKLLYEQLKQREDICLGYMPQNYEEAMDMALTPVQYLLNEGDREDITRCHELLGVMKFTAEEMLHSIREISEGQKAKLYILGFMKRHCNVLLLDEPTRNLSPLSAPAIIAMLQEYTGCIIAVSHDRHFIETLSARILMIDKQRIKEMI